MNRQSVGNRDTMLIAKAIYDNEGETGDELSFDREDILAVLEEDYNGMEGWWLCSLRGKTGIAPANRLLVIHKIDVKSASTTVKGPRFPSEVVRSMDYDFPKPVVPKKIGGSFDNLLNITEDDCYSGPGGSHAARSTTSAKLKAQASLAKKRGVSTGNLLNSSNLAEYAVPASMSSSDYEVPKNYGKKAGNSSDEFGSGKGTCHVSGGSSKNKERPRNTSDRTCETPSRSPDRLPRNLPLPELKLWDRDSGLADYDTPTGGAKSVRSEDRTGPRNIAGKNGQASQQQPVRRPAETPPQAKSLSKAQTSEIVDPAFLSSLGEVRSAVMQITSYADKWRACTNPTTKLSIVKQVCVAVWKKLQALILEFSKCLAKFKGRALSPLDDRLGAIKVVTAELERILNYISSCHPNDIHQGCIDYVTELVIIAKDIEGHLDYCTSFLNSDLGDRLACPSKTSKYFGYSRLSSSDDTTSEADKRQLQVRRAPALPPPRVVVPLKTSEAFEDDFSISAVSYNSKTPTYGRSFSFDQLSSDYDTPKSSSVGLGSSPGHQDSDKASAVLRGAAARSTDVGHTKRNAVVVEKSRETFDILQRRNAHSQMTPLKLIAERTRSDQTDKTGNLDISNSAEYDYPTARNNNTTKPVANVQEARYWSRDLEEPVTAYDKRMLVFYSERLNAELSQLKSSCQALCHRSAETSDGQVSLATQIQTLIISAHKLAFVADTLVKNVTGAALRKRLQRQALEIIDKTKSIVSGIKSNRQQLSEVTDNLLAAAFAFQDIVIKGSK